MGEKTTTVKQKLHQSLKVKSDEKKRGAKRKTTGSLFWFYSISYGKMSSFVLRNHVSDGESSVWINLTVKAF